MPPPDITGGSWYAGLPGRARRTFVLDCLRGVFSGLIDTGPRTFFLLIAVRQFAAGDLAKSLISIPTAVGMLLAVLLVDLYRRLPWSKSRLAALGRLLAALCFFLAAAWDGLVPYVLFVFLATIFHPATIPLLTAIYHDNYPVAVRGKLFAWAATFNIASSAFFHWAIGLFLDRHMDGYRLVLLGFGIMSLLTAWALARLPSSPPGPPDGGRPGSPARFAGDARATVRRGLRPAQMFSFLRAFRWIGRDRAFAYMLLAWFLFGFASLMTLPLKVLYLTEQRYGLVLPSAVVAMVVGLIPDAVRLVAMPVWAHFFDRYNFVGIRMVMNFFLLASLAVFFHSRALPLLVLAEIFSGLFLSGGNLAWSLWVTRFAPRGHTAEYMAVHQFFTGVRGILAVFLGIRLASTVGIRPVAWLALALVALSMALMFPIRAFGRPGRDGETAVASTPEPAAGEG